MRHHSGVWIFCLGGYSQGVCEWKSPSGVQGQSPSRGSGRRSPPEAELQCEIYDPKNHFTPHFCHVLFYTVSAILVYLCIRVMPASQPTTGSFV